MSAALADRTSSPPVDAVAGPRRVPRPADRALIGEAPPPGATICPSALEALRWGEVSVIGDRARVLDAALDLRREEDLERAYQLHAGELMRFAAYRLGDHALAADTVQEVFVRAWRHAARYDPSIASLRVWLFTIARNVVHDQLRRRRSRPDEREPTAPEDLAGLADGGPHSDRSDLFSDELTTGWVLRDALGRLSEEQRCAIVETYVRGRPYADVAAERGVPVGTLRSRVFYGLKNLRTAMDEMGVTP